MQNNYYYYNNNDNNLNDNDNTQPSHQMNLQSVGNLQSFTIQSQLSQQTSQSSVTTNPQVQDELSIEYIPQIQSTQSELPRDATACVLPSTWVEQNCR